MFKEIKTYNAREWAKLLLIIFLVVSVGLFAVNQFVEFRYSAELLTTPCEFCLKLNKNIDLCPRVEAIDFNKDNKIIPPVDFPALP